MKSTKLKPQTTSASIEAIGPTINPWTNKTKIRGQGMLNDIINKHLNNEQQIGQQAQSKVVSAQQKQILKLAQKIRRRYKIEDKIEGNMKQLFELRKRCDKINQILEWIDKIQTRSVSATTKSQPSSQPIDSNFIYLPLHSGTVFHEILQDCVVKDRNKSIGEYRNGKLKEFVEQLREVSSQDYNKLLTDSIL